MEQLLPLARKIAARLIERHQTIAVAEGSCGGLMSAALLAVPARPRIFAAAV
jgi:nicotinamide mononucleotide (NMN) deamidase PncC